MFYIGIHLEKEELKVATLKVERKALTIDSLQTFSPGPDSVKLFYNLPPFHTGRGAEIVSGLSGSEVFIRKLHLPLREKRKILATLPFQLETLIPFPLDEALICPLLKPLSKQMTSVTIIAALKEQLSSHLSALQKNFDIEPSHVSCVPIALGRFARWQFPKEPRILSLHSQKDRLTCTLLENGELVLSQTLSLSTNEGTAAELEKFFIFLKQKATIDDATPYLTTGELDLAETVKQFFPGPQLQLQDLALKAYAIPIGLALDRVISDASTVQFCQKEFTPRNVLASRKKKMSIYLGTCLAAALLMATCGSLILGKKQKMITNQLKSYLPANLAKSPLTTPEEIQKKLGEWEKSLSRHKMPFTLLPTVPKVSDVLAWLSVHPSFSKEDGTKKEGLEIRSLHYSLLKYPKIGEASSPYLAHMDIELTSPAPRAARDFHEALLKGDQIVNAKKEVKWQVQNQTYHTSFELNKKATP